MQITSPILNYALETPGSFYVEENDNQYFIYFDDASQDIENSIKVDDTSEDQLTIYTTSKHDFNSEMGFMANLCMTTDKECAEMICQALNNLKDIYTKAKS